MMVAQAGLSDKFGSVNILSPSLGHLGAKHARSRLVVVDRKSFSPLPTLPSCSRMEVIPLFCIIQDFALSVYQAVVPIS